MTLLQLFKHLTTVIDRSRTIHTQNQSKYAGNQNYTRGNSVNKNGCKQNRKAPNHRHANISTAPEHGMKRTKKKHNKPRTNQRPYNLKPHH